MAENNGDSNKISESFSLEVSKLKKDLNDWKFILLPLNNLLEWEHKFDPLVIIVIVSTIFGIIMSWSPSVLTTISVFCIIALVFDFAVPIITQQLFKTTEWTLSSDAKYTRICERISHFYGHLIRMKTRLIELRREKHSLYFLIVLFVLIFSIYVGQLVDNLLLSYLVSLTLCLLPGARRHNLPQIALNLIKSFIAKKPGNGRVSEDEKKEI